MNEEWREIKGFPDYAVSNMGGIKRLRASRNNRKAEFVLRTEPNPKTGYVQVVLFKNGERHIKMVHRLVLEAFMVTPPSLEHQINHKDGIKHHNHVCNLEWVTCRENIIHAHKNGLHGAVRGERSNLAKLSSNDVWLIKRLLAHGVFQWVIAKMFLVDRATISYIHSGKTWREIIYDGTARPPTTERGTGSIKKGSRHCWSGKWQKPHARGANLLAG